MSSTRFKPHICGSPHQTSASCGKQETENQRCHIHFLDRLRVGEPLVQKSREDSQEAWEIQRVNVLEQPDTIAEGEELGARLGI